MNKTKELIAFTKRWNVEESGPHRLAKMLEHALICFDCCVSEKGRTDEWREDFAHGIFKEIEAIAREK